MGIPSAGDIVVLPFPFSDLTTNKVRPAVVLARANKSDWILCQITSNPYGDAQAIVIDTTDFKTGMLRLKSYARPSKLFTANESLIIGIEGSLKPEKLLEIRNAIIKILSEEPSKTEED
jgi:mRNA interferase MazF